MGCVAVEKIDQVLHTWKDYLWTQMKGDLLVYICFRGC